METFLPEVVKQVGMALITGAVLLVWVARRFPNVSWLQRFQFPEFRPKRSPAQEARHRRVANVITALEIMLFGLAFPVLYVLSKVMMFDDLERVPLILSFAATGVCFCIGIWILLRAKS